MADLMMEGKFVGVASNNADFGENGGTARAGLDVFMVELQKLAFRAIVVENVLIHFIGEVAMRFGCNFLEIETGRIEISLIHIYIYSTSDIGLLIPFSSSKVFPSSLCT